MDKTIIKAIQENRKLRKNHIEMGKLILKAHGGDLYPLDLLAVATLNRSMCLLRGFCDLLEGRNFIAAVPLLRLQLDNVIRFSAAWLVDDPHKFALSILDGKQVNHLSDSNGHKMTDRYLVEKLSEEDPRISKLYDLASGYVHLSNKHIFSSIHSVGDEGNWKMKITDEDTFVPDSLYREALNAFTGVTQLLFEFMDGWAYTKENPDITKNKKGRNISDK